MFEVNLGFVLGRIHSHPGLRVVQTRDLWIRRVLVESGRSSPTHCYDLAVLGFVYMSFVTGSLGSSLCHPDKPSDLGLWLGRSVCLLPFSKLEGGCLTEQTSGVLGWKRPLDPCIGSYTQTGLSFPFCLGNVDCSGDGRETSGGAS